MTASGLATESTRSGFAICRPRTPGWRWCAIAPPGFAASSRNASSCPMPPTSCATRSPASRVRSRSCAPAPRTIPTRAITSWPVSRRTSSGSPRLTDSLLTLARMEAVEKETTEALDVGITIEEAAQAVAPPDGIEVRLDLGADVAARGDPVLLRQVLIDCIKFGQQLVTVGDRPRRWGIDKRKLAHIAQTERLMRG